jgi:hypothetical protein
MATKSLDMGSKTEHPIFLVYRTTHILIVSVVCVCCAPQPRKVQYAFAIDGIPASAVNLPAKGQLWHWAHYSCNGLSAGQDPVRFSEVSLVPWHFLSPWCR